ncbi:MAG: TIR domain-containing protein [Gemmatimonadetes bacterium]|nr:TIR domain-containing protein [Gemmatimonadota bacterium]
MSVVFISYTASDREFTERLASDLQHAGFDARASIELISRSSEPSEVTVENRIAKAIYEAEFFIPVLSPASSRSKGIVQEIKQAVEAELTHYAARVFPVLAHSCYLPQEIGLRTPSDFSRSYSNGFEDLIDRLGTKLQIAPPQSELSESSEGIAHLLEVEMASYLRTRRRSGVWELERAAGGFLRDLGYSVELTHTSSDAGIDLLAIGGRNRDDVPVFLQCKYYQEGKRLGVEVLRSLVLSRIKPDTKLVIVVVASSFMDAYPSNPSRKFPALTRDRWELDYKHARQWLDWLGVLALEKNTYRPLDQLRERHGGLVDKKFLDGLTSAEARELVQLEEFLDEVESPFYKPFINHLEAVHASLLDKNRQREEEK